MIGGTALPAELADVEARLITSLQTSAFLTLAVDPHRLDEAASALVTRFAVNPYDVTWHPLTAMRREAEASNVVWDVVLRVDRAGAGVVRADPRRDDHLARGA